MSNTTIHTTPVTTATTSTTQVKQASAGKKAQPQRGPAHAQQATSLKSTGTTSQAVATTLPKQVTRKDAKEKDKAKHSSGATKGKASQSMQTAAGLVSYTNDEIIRLTRRNAGIQEASEDPHTTIQARIQRGFDLTTSVLAGAKTDKPSKQDVADIVLFLDAKARASHSLSRSASFSIADPKGRLDKYLNSCESAHDGSTQGASSAQGRKLVHAIDFGNVAGPLASGKQSVAFGAFQIDGQRHLFLKALSQGYKINVETVADTGARVSATGEPNTGIPSANGTSAPVPISSMATSASVKADVAHLTNGEEQKFITNVYRAFQDAVAKANAGLTCANQTEIYAMVKEVKTVIAHAGSLVNDNVGKIALLMAVETFAQTWADHGNNFSHLDRRIGDETIFTLDELKDASYANNLSTQSTEAISDVKAFRATILKHLRAQMGLAQVNTTSLPTHAGISSQVQDGAKPTSVLGTGASKISTPASQSAVKPSQTTPQGAVKASVPDQGISVWDTAPAGFQLCSQDISTNIVQNVANGAHKNTCFILAPIRAMLENPAIRTALMNRIYEGPNGEFCIKLKYIDKEYSVIVKPDDEDYKQYLQPDGRQAVTTALECAITRFYTTMTEPTHKYGEMGEASRVAGFLGMSMDVETISDIINSTLQAGGTHKVKAEIILNLLQKNPKYVFVIGDGSHFVQFRLGDNGNDIQVGNSLVEANPNPVQRLTSPRTGSTYTLTTEEFIKQTIPLLQAKQEAAIYAYALDEQATVRVHVPTADLLNLDATSEQQPPVSRPQPSAVDLLLDSNSMTTQVQVTVEDIIDNFKNLATHSSGYTRPRNTATASTQATASATTAATDTAVTSPASTTTITTTINADPTPLASATKTIASIRDAVTEDDASPISSAKLPAGSTFSAIPVGFTQITFNVNNNTSFQTHNTLVNLVMQQVLGKLPMQSELAKRVTFKQSGTIFNRKYEYCVQFNDNNGQPFYVKVDSSDFPKNTKHPNMQAALSAALSKFYPQSDDIDAIDNIDTIKHIVEALGLQYQTIQQTQLQDTINNWNINTVGLLQGINGVVFQPATRNSTNINIIHPQPSTTGASPDMWISFEDYKMQQEALASDTSTTLKPDRELRQDYQKQYHPILSPRNSAVTRFGTDDFIRGTSEGVDELSVMPEIALITAKE